MPSLKENHSVARAGVAMLACTGHQCCKMVRRGSDSPGQASRGPLLPMPLQDLMPPRARSRRPAPSRTSAHLLNLPRVHIPFRKWHDIIVVHRYDSTGRNTALRGRPPRLGSRLGHPPLTSAAAADADTRPAANQLHVGRPRWCPLLCAWLPGRCRPHARPCPCACRCHLHFVKRRGGVP